MMTDAHTIIFNAQTNHNERNKPYDTH
jgi:hypothetical protein